MNQEITPLVTSILKGWQDYLQMPRDVKSVDGGLQTPWRRLSVVYPVAHLASQAAGLYHQRAGSKNKAGVNIIP